MILSFFSHPIPASNQDSTPHQTIPTPPRYSYGKYIIFYPNQHILTSLRGSALHMNTKYRTDTQKTSHTADLPPPSPLPLDSSLFNIHHLCCFFLHTRPIPPLEYRKHRDNLASHRVIFLPLPCTHLQYKTIPLIIIILLSRTTQSFF